MNRFTVRPYDPADAAGCAATMSAAMAASPVWPGDTVVSPPNFSSQTKDDTIWVAEYGVKIIGVASLYPPEALLRHIYVRPPSQRQSVGAHLLSAIQSVANAPLNLKCLTANSAARQFFGKHGYIEPDEPGGKEKLGAWIWIKQSV
jgi:GNAT superfamily N-acetyltransferase